jgi:ribosomal protein L18E
VVENTIDLFPLIILLTVLIIFEFLIFGLLIFIRANRKRKENSNMLPMLSAYFVNPFTIVSAARIRPSGAVGTTILLSVAALALGCGIALLLRAELRESATKKAQSARVKRKAPEQTDTPLLSSVKRSLLKAKVYELNSAKELLREGRDERYFDEDTPEKEKIPCTVGAAGEDEISEVSYDISHDEESASSKHRKHKCEINLDVIAGSFEAGELVTLEALKRRNIVPKRADHLKILARGAISKPLIVEAHDFTHAAEEMLKAAGGEAIRIRR